MEDSSFFAPPPVRGLYDAAAADEFAFDAADGDDLPDKSRMVPMGGSFLLSGIKPMTDDNEHTAFDSHSRGHSPFDEFARSGFRVADRSLDRVAAHAEPHVLDGPEETQVDTERPEEVEFARAVEHYLESDVFTLLARFEGICSARAEEMQQRLVPEAAGALVASSYEIMRARRDCSLLKAERNTWLLMSFLYKDRLLTTSPDSNTSDDKQESQALTLSQRRIKKELIKHSRAFREIRAVVKWLQQLAKLDGVQTYRIEAGRNHTLRALHGSDRDKRATASDLVSSIDPDAPARQDKQLHEEDWSDEQVLSQVVWNLIRAGCKKEALDFCRQSEQYWHAASLSGHLSKEPMLFSDDMTNSSYKMWQSVCRAISDEVEYFDEYERAIYATLSGNVDRILPVCQSWEDHLWAHFKGLLHDTLEMHLSQRKPYSSADSSESDEDERIRNRVMDIFDRLLKSDSAQIRQSVNEAHHIAQTRLILNMEEQLLDDLASWVSTPKESEVCEPSLIRLAAHVGLFFRQVSGPHPVIDVLIEAYVRHLIKTKQIALVAIYTAKLPVEHQVETYANFLRNITERDERERCLDFADRAGLNVNAITKRVVELIQDASAGTLSIAGEGKLATAETISTEDEAAIKAIEWLTFDPDQRIDALVHANALARKFIAADKRNALDKLLQSLPRDSISVVKRRWSVKQTAGEEDIAREYVCYQYLSAARNAYDAWSYHMRRQPIAPEAPPASMNPSKSALVLHSNRVRAYKEDLHQWQVQGWSLAETAMRALYAVLLFQNGWLQDLPTSPPPTSPAEVGRAHEMDQLRRKVIPEIFFKCHAVLFENKQYQDSMELADLLANEYYRFHHTFTQAQLRDFLGLMRRSALVLEKQQEDGVGLSLAGDITLRA